MLKRLLIFSLLLAGSAMAQQEPSQAFAFLGTSSNGINYDVLPPYHLGILNRASTTTNPPDVASDYAPIVSDDLANVLKTTGTTVIGDGFVRSLHVTAYMSNGGSTVFATITCADLDDAIRVHDGDRIGLYINDPSFTVIVVVGSTQTALQCSLTPRTTNQMVRVYGEFVKR